jgi:hypothetical protein
MSSEGSGLHYPVFYLFTTQSTMTNTPKTVSSTYTCNDYREEMILLGLRQKLLQSDLTEEERTKLTKEIARLEKIIGF